MTETHISQAHHSAPLRLFMVLPTIGRRGGGVAESARLLAHELAQRGDIALEIVTRRTADYDEALPAWPDVPIHAFATLGPMRFGLSPAMIAFLRRNRADVLHVHGVWGLHGLAAHLSHRRWRDQRVVITPHGMFEAWIMARSPRMKAFVTALFQNRFLQDATVIQVLTEKERDDVRHAARGAAQCAVVPNFVPLRAATALPSWWRAGMEGRRIHLFLGRIHEKKGWRELCAAWEQLCESDPGFAGRNHLVFCGWVDDTPDFVPRTTELGARFGNLTYAGPQYGADKDASFAAADTFLLPSKSEGLPMAVLEAWAAGLTVLMTEACNLPIGFEREAAIRISPEAEALTRELAAFDRMEAAELDRISENGRLLHREVFSPEAVVGAMVRLYRGAGAKPHNSARPELAGAGRKVTL